MRYHLLLGSLLLCGAVAGLKAQTGENVPLAQLRVGKIDIFSLDEKSPSWTIEIGKAKGFFQNEGLAVELVPTQDFDSQIEGLVRGDFEVGHQGTAHAIREIENGAPLFLFMADRRGPILTLMTGPSIRSFEDLRGRRVGSAGPDAQDYLPLIKMLAVNGLSMEDYQIVVAGNVASRYQALKVGRIAGGLLGGPILREAENAGLTSLGKVDDYLGDFPFSAAAARRDWADQNGDVLRAYIGAYLRSVGWLLDPSNDKEAMGIMQEKAQLDHETAATLYDWTLDRLLADAELSVGGIQAVVETMVQAGLLEPGSHLPEKYLDRSFLTSAREDLVEK